MEKNATSARTHSWVGEEGQKHSLHALRLSASETTRRECLTSRWGRGSDCWLLYKPPQANRRKTHSEQDNSKKLSLQQSRPVTLQNTQHPDTRNPRDLMKLLWSAKETAIHTFAQEPAVAVERTGGDVSFDTGCKRYAAACLPCMRE